MMNKLRHWTIDTTLPFSLPLAADARLSQTDYADDQIWELHLGTGDSAGLALQTQYGGRVGLASLVPMWGHDGRIIYQAQTYAKPPIITAFAPAYLQLEAQITPSLQLSAQYWVMESHAVGGIFTITNTGDRAENLRCDLFGHVIAKEKEQKLAIIALEDNLNALSLGAVGNLSPVVVVENGQAEANSASPKVGVNLQILINSKIQVRWVHAGRPDLRDSLTLAQGWLNTDWPPYLTQVEQAAQAIPNITTNNSELDAVLASAYHNLVQAFLKPTATLPYPSFVASRQTWQGYSPRGDGSDHPRAWAGQSPTLSYLLSSALATIDPQIAQGLVKNYIAVQTADGGIDSKPGLAGQKEGLLCLPILARLAWNIYESTEDQQFLSDVFEPLLKFFERWFASDVDTDGDGFPEWQNERQTGYSFTPTFSVGSTWAQNANIRLAETPDLLTYLISEANSLRSMAQALGKKRPVTQLDKHITTLQAHLESLWQSGHYAYRDRDTHNSTSSMVVLDEGRGDEEHILALTLDPANRLVVRLTGGASNVPRGQMILDGIDHQGKAISEQADFKQFIWTYGRGVYTTEHAFSQVDRIRCEGLSRVYRIHVESVDYTRLDINALLPLWTGSISDERAEALIKLTIDKRHFWHNSGLAMNSTQDAAFDPSGANGSGSVWPYWTALIAEGLLHYGHSKQATDLLQNLLKTQIQVLTEQKKFYMFYHADEPKGLGERGHLDGLFPLHLLTQVFGVQVVSSGKVRIHDTFAWGKSIKIQQHGVLVKRSAKKISITFPSGYHTDVTPTPSWQVITDPQPVPAPLITPLPGVANKAAKLDNTSRTGSKSVIINVQIDPKDQ